MNRHPLVVRDCGRCGLLRSGVCSPVCGLDRDCVTTVWHTGPRDAALDALGAEPEDPPYDGFIERDAS